MSRGEVIRLGLVSAILLILLCCVLGRLVELQLLGDAAGRPALAARSYRLPAARGAIEDRGGRTLAWDRPVFEARIRAEVLAGLSGKLDEAPDYEALRPACERLLGELLWAADRDRDRFGTRASRSALRGQLAGRIESAIAHAVDRGERGIDFLFDRALDHAGVIAALLELDVRHAPKSDKREKSLYRCYVNLQQRWEREYAEDSSLFGLVGRVQPGALFRGEKGGDRRLVDDRVPMLGIERLACLLPGESGVASVRADARARPYWTAKTSPAASPPILRMTVDYELQTLADRELADAAEAIRTRYGHPPEWGALVLVDARDGAVVAAASYTAAKDGSRDPHGAFAPAQRLFEPGSVVKPLSLAMVLDRGLMSMDEMVDCRPGYLAGTDFVQPGTRLPRRTIRDDHENAIITPREVLIRSSNIGAVRLGLRMGAAGVDEYLENYRFGRRTAIDFPGELAGQRPESIAAANPREQLVYAGPSVLFGYQIACTPLQLARAFLSFLAGRPRELYLVDSLERDGERLLGPRGEDGASFASAAALADIRGALVGVVEDEHGTARGVGRWLRELRTRTGRTDLTIAGKTGTSEYVGATTRWDGSKFHGDIRTSSFAGFTPVDEPHYLAVCVFQKAGAGAFYGGLYAAPAASRLLVAALDRESRVVRTSETDGSASVALETSSEPGGSDFRQRRR
jgi:cell division protein FtsI/penicillin-binding protein 2